jgi:hypothetical protein
MTLKLDQGTIYDCPYYTVTPKFGTLVFTWMKPDWDNMVAWCVDTYGPGPVDGVWTPGARWYVNNAKFWFRDKPDCEWFMLRWS